MKNLRKLAHCRLTARLKLNICQWTHNPEIHQQCHLKKKLLKIQLKIGGFCCTIVNGNFVRGRRAIENVFVQRFALVFHVILLRAKSVNIVVTASFGTCFNTSTMVFIFGRSFGLNDQHFCTRSSTDFTINPSIGIFSPLLETEQTSRKQSSTASFYFNTRCAIFMGKTPAHGGRFVKISTIKMPNESAPKINA